MLEQLGRPPDMQGLQVADSAWHVVFLMLSFCALVMAAVARLAYSLFADKTVI